ncbi:ubiquitin specific peptidase 47 [Pelomyxa schiedti]|nr:ubiquitin specific peptidase 47 [Pelomyxa schiedti]
MSAMEEDPQQNSAPQVLIVLYEPMEGAPATHRYFLPVHSNLSVQDFLLEKLPYLKKIALSESILRITGHANCYGAEFLATPITAFRSTEEQPRVLLSLPNELKDPSKTGRSSNSSSSNYGSSTSSTSNFSRPRQNIPPETFSDTKSPTGFVGLSNQGATCYLNSVIQALYMTPELRTALYQWSPEVNLSKEDLKKTSTILDNLQRLFALLQKSEKKAVKTIKLTKSFGWDASESFIQHDAQELYRLLIDEIETGFKGTPQEGITNKLWQGQMTDSVKCLECKNVSAKLVSYQDISLDIKDGGAVAIKNVNEALQKFVQPELLEKENQYFCAVCNKKVNAQKSLSLKTVPYILTLHLKRFTFDFTKNQRIKLNDSVAFPTVLDVAPLLSNEGQHESSCSSTECDAMDIAPSLPSTSHGNYFKYDLYAILVHSGNASGGHYYAFIKNFESNQWYNFNDSNVTKIPESDISACYGVSQDGYGTAYMLMYRQVNPTRNVNIVPDTAIPPALDSLVKHKNETWNVKVMKKKMLSESFEISVVYKYYEHLLTVYQKKTLLELKNEVKDLFKLSSDFVFVTNTNTDNLWRSGTPLPQEDSATIGSLGLARRQVLCVVNANALLLSGEASVWRIGTFESGSYRYSHWYAGKNETVQQFKEKIGVSHDLILCTRKGNKVLGDPNETLPLPDDSSCMWLSSTPDCDLIPNITNPEHFKVKLGTNGEETVHLFLPHGLVTLNELKSAVADTLKSVGVEQHAAMWDTKRVRIFRGYNWNVEIVDHSSTLLALNVVGGTPLVALPSPVYPCLIVHTFIHTEMAFSNALQIEQAHTYGTVANLKHAIAKTDPLRYPNSSHLRLIPVFRKSEYRLKMTLPDCMPIQDICQDEFDVAVWDIGKPEEVHDIEQIVIYVVSWAKQPATPDPIFEVVLSRYETIRTLKSKIFARCNISTQRDCFRLYPLPIEYTVTAAISHTLPTVDMLASLPCAFQDTDILQDSLPDSCAVVLLPDVIYVTTLAPAEQAPPKKERALTLGS